MASSYVPVRLSPVKPKPKPKAAAAASKHSCKKKIITTTNDNEKKKKKPQAAANTTTTAKMKAKHQLQQWRQRQKKQKQTSSIEITSSSSSSSSSASSATTSDNSKEEEEESEFSAEQTSSEEDPSDSDGDYIIPTPRARAAMAAAAAAVKKRNTQKKRTTSQRTTDGIGSTGSLDMPPPRAKKRQKRTGAGAAGAKGAKAVAAAATSSTRLRGKKGHVLPPVMTNLDAVMRRVNKLRDKTVAQRREQEAKGILTLSDLQLPDVNKEVEVMHENEVRAEIEKLIVDSVNSILKERGFSFSVPSRSSDNQLYVPAIDRIVLKNKATQRVFASLQHSRKTAITTRILTLVHELCIKRIHVTKRDLFYTDVKLFESQDQTDPVLDDVACMIGCTRNSLNVVASEKGIVVGQLTFVDDGDLIDCARMGVGGKTIPPYTDRITDIRSPAKFILLVEKDAAFMRLAEDRFYNTYPCIIITAKGQPDVATRLFLKRLKSELCIPVLGLVDSDPYGMKILSVYMSGSKNMSYDSASLTTSDIKWLGVRPSDLDKYNIPEQCRLKMTDRDIKMGRDLLQEDFIQEKKEWHDELAMMLETGEKAEIQALSNFGFQYLTKVYLPLKLQEGDWI